MAEGNEGTWEGQGEVTLLRCDKYLSSSWSNRKPLQPSHPDNYLVAWPVTCADSQITCAAREKAPDEGPGLCPLAQQDWDGGWEPLATLAQHFSQGPTCPAQLLRGLAAPISAPTELWSLLALICKWASAQAKDSAGIRPGSQTLNWSWAFHYHTPVPQHHMVRGK